MSKEFTFGIKLSESVKEHKFAVKGSEFNGAPIHHSLILKMVVLGPKCKKGELNVVEFATTSFGESKLECVLCCLQSSSEKNYDQCLVDVTFTSDVTFKLTQGSGPIMLTGQQISEYVIEGDSEDEMPSEDNDDEDVEPETKSEPEVKPTNKRKLGKNKKGEPESPEPSDDENAKPKKKPVQPANKSKTGKPK